MDGIEVLQSEEGWITEFSQERHCTIVYFYDKASTHMPIYTMYGKQVPVPFHCPEVDEIASTNSARRCSSAADSFGLRSQNSVSGRVVSCAAPPT